MNITKNKSVQYVKKSSFVANVAKVSGQTVFIYILGFIIFLSLLTLAGCSGQSEELNASLGQTVNLAPGQTVSITGESLEIKFIEVTNDSRCPTGVNCPWEGAVTCATEIEYQGSTYQVTLNHQGSGAGTADFNNCVITFEVSPYPEANKQINKEDYRLQLSVTKK